MENWTAAVVVSFSTQCKGENRSNRKQTSLFSFPKLGLSFWQTGKIAKDCPAKEIQWLAMFFSSKSLIFFFFFFCVCVCVLFFSLKCFLCTTLICQILNQGKFSYCVCLSWPQCRVCSITLRPGWKSVLIEMSKHRAHVGAIVPLYLPSLPSRQHAWTSSEGKSCLCYTRWDNRYLWSLWPHHFSAACGQTSSYCRSCISWESKLPPPRS